MKKYFAFFCLLTMAVLNVSATPIERLYFSVERNIVDLSPTLPKPNRMPVNCPEVLFQGHTLYFNNVGYDLTLVLLDEDENEAYAVYVPVGTDAVVLPSYLSGVYEILLQPEGEYYFYSEIAF